MTESTAIVFTRHQGRAITVDHAPTHARISLHVLVDRYAYLHMPTPQTIVFADQVVYRITGYTDGVLELELAEDWRPAPTAKLTQADVDEIKARWLETYGKPGTAHPVTDVGEEER